ncbi:MAG: hypothetical protein IPM18_12750 [Phycisphaerales bacterium]|nr:hypothetical protein [Phycisphaerales bacterium]
MPHATSNIRWYICIPDDGSSPHVLGTASNRAMVLARLMTRDMSPELSDVETSEGLRVAGVVGTLEWLHDPPPPPDVQNAAIESLILALNRWELEGRLVGLR